MSIPYSEKSDVTLGSKVSTVLLNKIFQRLVDNDNSILPQTYGIPYVWEAKWFNDPTVEGYKKGDAVWVNTETVDDFVSKNKSSVYNYLVNNQAYRERILRCEGDQSKLMELFKEVVSSGELYWLGDINLPAQIRVCKAEVSGGVKTLPIDDDSWEDFFVLRNDEKLKEEIVGQFQDIADEQFATHVETYHPEATADFDISKYMVSDFSNSSLNQRYNKPSVKQMEGFDKVKRFVVVNGEGETVRWFRVWSSGYLEHGGIINVEKPVGNDSVSYGETLGKIYTLRFDWVYDNNLVSPTYDYQSDTLENFHFSDNRVDFGEGIIPYDSENELGSYPRYFLSLSPFCLEDGGPYQNMNEAYAFFNTREVFSMTNRSFSFIVNGDCERYSYYVQGFTVNVAKRFP